MTDTPYGLLSLWQHGGTVIQAIAIALLVMSIACWTVITLKSLEIIRLQRSIRLSNAHTHTATTSNTRATQTTAPVSYSRVAQQTTHALVQYQTHQSHLKSHTTLPQWIEQQIEYCLEDIAHRLAKGVSILGTVAATSPFIGLLGTVWGIYHALIEIGVSGQAGLDRVAGPVGEALVMTALGLAVAIPAVLGNNALIRLQRSELFKLRHFAKALQTELLINPPIAELTNVDPATAELKKSDAFNTRAAA